MPRLARWILHVSALATPWVVAIWLGATLPDRYPVHFDGSGTPDRWAGPGHGEWYLLAGIATFVECMLVGGGALATFCAMRAPEYVNVPAKAAFVRLPPMARASDRVGRSHAEACTMDPSRPCPDHAVGGRHLARDDAA